MATTVTTTPVTEAGPTAADAFLADRQAFWGSFTRFVTIAAAGIALLLVVLAVWLV